MFEQLTADEKAALAEIRKAKAAANDPRVVANDALTTLAKRRAAADGVSIDRGMVAVLETEIGKSLYTVFRTPADEFVDPASVIAQINAAVAG